MSQSQKKEKQGSLTPGLLNSVATIKVNKVETSSSGQYKIKPKLKAEVKVSYICNFLEIIINQEYLVSKLLELLMY